MVSGKLANGSVNFFVFGLRCLLNYNLRFLAQPCSKHLKSQAQLNANNDRELTMRPFPDLSANSFLIYSIIHWDNKQRLVGKHGIGEVSRLEVLIASRANNIFAFPFAFLANNFDLCITNSTAKK